MLFVAIKAFLQLARFENALLPALGLIAGYEAAANHSSLSLFVRLLAFVLIHSVVTIWNDICDETSDRLNGITRIAQLRKRNAYGSLVAITYLSAAVSLGLCLWLPLDVACLLASGVGLGWLYDHPPLRASRRPIASITVLAFGYGLFPFLVGSGVRAFSWRLAVLAVSWMLIRTSLSLLKDYKDAPGDAKAGKRTFLLRYGNTAVARASLSLAVVGYAACVTAVCLYSSHPLLAGITLGVVATGFIALRTQLFRAQDYATLNMLFHRFLEYQLLFDGLAVVWLHLR